MKVGASLSWRLLLLFVFREKWVSQKKYSMRNWIGPGIRTTILLSNFSLKKDRSEDWVNPKSSRTFFLCDASATLERPTSDWRKQGWRCPTVSSPHAWQVHITVHRRCSYCTVNPHTTNCNVRVASGLACFGPYRSCLGCVPVDLSIGTFSRALRS